MVRVSAADFGREVGKYQDVALTQPVMVTRNGRDRTVLISADEYRRLMSRERLVRAATEFTDAELAFIRQATPPAEASAFNHEYAPLR